MPLSWELRKGKGDDQTNYWRKRSLGLTMDIVDNGIELEDDSGVIELEDDSGWIELEDGP